MRPGGVGYWVSYKVVFIFSATSRLSHYMTCNGRLNPIKTLCMHGTQLMFLTYIQVCNKANCNTGVLNLFFSCISITHIKCCRLATHISTKNVHVLLIMYNLQTIPVTMAKLRTIHTICPPEVFRFILELFKYNDNSRNKVWLSMIIVMMRWSEWW